MASQSLSTVERDHSSCAHCETPEKVTNPDPAQGSALRAQGRLFYARSLRDAFCRRRSLRPKRSAQTKLPTPLASSGAVGKTKNCQAENCLTELGVSGQRRLSVGGAISFLATPVASSNARHRRIVPAPVASSRGLVGPSGSRIRRHRWLQANEPCRTPPVDAANVRFRPGKNFRDQRLENTVPTG